MQAISDRIHPETWIHVYNQMALGLRYVDGGLEEACTYIEEAERVLATMKHPLVLTNTININNFLGAIELSAAARHTMNKGAIYKKAGRNVAITDAKALEGLMQTPSYRAYTQTSLATEFMAESKYAEAYALAHEAHGIYLSIGIVDTVNALSTLLTLVEAGVASNQDVMAYYATAQDIYASLKLDANHDFSKRMLALEPQMSAILELSKVETATSSVDVTPTGLGFTAQLEVDNAAEQARQEQEQEQERKAGQIPVTSANI
jgi:hypothetical protein